MHEAAARVPATGCFMGAYLIVGINASDSLRGIEPLY